ncbi:efflux RND transporter periplasmic adaptor subunit [Pontivivens ytuae]|uniref:Efflux RND transporter periplasmic adaptor subunit n=1 Tax=Pontivivens ytuae TaxID=2789856 RepID=A0A7S9QCE2_9RHOB|nr:efflux RND transporter periplasmic adaptor subunit [Pontivivens ytuae]
MKILPILSAILVIGALYMVVLERERLMAWLPAPAETEETAEAVAEEETVAVIEETDVTQPIAVVALRSEAREVQSGIILRGRTEAARNVDVAAETTGQVISPPLRKGRQVQEGDLLCRLDAQTRQAELAQARAALAEAQANEVAASQLSQRGITSENQAISRRAQLEAAIASVEAAEREIERLEIRAPFAGVLETDTAELGSLLTSGTVCATILDLSEIRLVGFAAERDVNKIQVGAQAGARLISGEEVTGQVVFVGRSADPLTRTFRVEVVVPNADGALRDGSTAEIVIALAGVTAHLLPQASLTLDDTGALGVRVVEEGVAMFKPVEIIRDGADGVWVSGLDTQEDVIVVGQEFVNDGRSVAPTFREAGADETDHTFLIPGLPLDGPAPQLTTLADMMPSESEGDEAALSASDVLADAPAQAVQAEIGMAPPRARPGNLRVPDAAAEDIAQ